MCLKKIFFNILKFFKNFKKLNLKKIKKKYKIKDLKLKEN